MKQIVSVLSTISFLFISNISYAKDPASIGIGTQIKFEVPTGAIYFKPCSDRPADSCASFEKVESQMSSKKCTYRVVNADISRMEIPIAGRTLTVSKIVKRNSSNHAVSIQLTGAKAPIQLSCMGENRYPTGTQSMPDFPLTEDLLSNFKDFRMEKVVLEESESNSSKPSAPAKQKGKSEGAVI